MFPQQLPAGSDIRLDFPFNGNGVAEAGGASEDPLFAKAVSVLDKLFWCSHTWSHLDLTINDQVETPYPTTYQETYDEIMKNRDFALELFGTPYYPSYSYRFMVTPGISGLFNGNAIKALLDAGRNKLT